jgi:hypothetical protein
MSLTPQQLVDRLTAIVPQFADHWASPENLFRDGNGAFTYCGVFARCSHCIRDHFQDLSVKQQKELAGFIKECMAKPGIDIKSAAATCFLENRVGESFSAEWEACLGARAAKFVRQVSGT